MAGEYGTPTQLPALPEVTNANVRDVAERVKEIIEIWQGARGDGMDRVLTVRDLLNGRVIDQEVAVAVYESAGTPVPRGIPTRPPDAAIPPTPGPLEASGAVGNIILSWEFPFAYSRLAYFELWRSATNALGDATLIAQPFASVYADAVSLAASYYYWVRAVSDGGVSPFNAVAGTLGETAPAFEEVPDGENNGEAVTAGVYLVDAYLKNGVITRAKIGNLAVDTAKIANLAVTDAKIASLSVAKLLAGNMAVGQYIRSTSYVPGVSGFSIYADGTGEANDWTLRGGIYASYGAIGGILIGSDHISSTNWNSTTGPTGTGWAARGDGDVYLNQAYIRGQLNGGAFDGYAWPAGTGTGYHLSQYGLLVGNPSTGKYFQIDGGNIYAPQFSIVDGVATFSGSLSAASGTFQGALNGATGTFSGSLTAPVVNTDNIIGAAVSQGYADLGGPVAGQYAEVTFIVPPGASSVLVIGNTGASYSSGGSETDGGGAGDDYGALELYGPGGGLHGSVAGRGTLFDVIEAPAAGTWVARCNRAALTWGISSRVPRLGVTVNKR